MKPKRFLIGYDYSCDKQRRRVCRLLKRYQVTCQKSVFEVRLTRYALNELLLEIAAKTDLPEASLFVLELNESDLSWYLGTGLVNPGGSILAVI